METAIRGSAMDIRLIAPRQPWASGSPYVANRFSPVFGSRIVRMPINGRNEHTL